MLPRPRTGTTWIVAGATVIVFTTLLFVNLGTYALWDDEARAALFGESVWRTGDTGAVFGHNVMAYRNGLELRGFKGRLLSPLSYYVEAPFVGIFGRSAFAARLPFAIMGVATLLLAFYWLWKDQARLRTWTLVGLAACANVPLVLFVRQARYYSLSTFLTLLVTFLYVHRDGTRRRTLALGLSGLALLANHYIAYAALGLALGVDYLIFERRSRRFTRPDLAILFGCQVPVGALILAIWNPLGKAVSDYVPASWIADKLTLWWWNIRDLNSAEFGSLMVVVAAPILYLQDKRQNAWLIRVPLAIVLYALAIAAFSPQPLGLTAGADVRFMQPIIPALIFLGVATIEALPLRQGWLRYAVAIFLFYTSVPNAMSAAFTGGPRVPVRSTFAAFAGELRTPIPSPYAEASTWIGRNVAAEQSVYVLPEYAAYPLMFHAPHAVYAWQLEASRRPEYPTLPAIHFKGEAFPDFIVVFAQDLQSGIRLVKLLGARGIAFTLRARLPVHGIDLTRPELAAHSFVAVTVGKPTSDGIFIFQRT